MNPSQKKDPTNEPISTTVDAQKLLEASNTPEHDEDFTDLQAERDPDNYDPFYYR